MANLRHRRDAPLPWFPYADAAARAVKYRRWRPYILAATLIWAVLASHVGLCTKTYCECMCRSNCHGARRRVPGASHCKEHARGCHRGCK